VRRYVPNPLVIGIFEFTMMRTGNDAGSREWAGLFHTYLLGETLRSRFLAAMTAGVLWQGKGWVTRT